MKQSDKSDNSGSPSSSAIHKSSLTSPAAAATSGLQQPPNISSTTGPINQSDLPATTGHEEEEEEQTATSESSETPLSTAPTSPLSNASATSSSYKSGTLTDDTANVAQGLQGVDNGEPQISQRAAYGEQMVGKLIPFALILFLIAPLCDYD